MSKRNVTISIEEYIHEKAREKGLNISALCEDTLRQVLGTFDRTIDPETCEHNWTFPFGTPMGLAKECKRCGKVQRVIIQIYEEIMGKDNETN